MHDVFSFWMIMTLVSSVFFYFSIVTVLILAERYLIRRRSRGEWILPIVALIAAIILSMITFKTHYSQYSGLMDEQIFSGEKEVGRLYLVADEKRNLIAVGQFITNEGEKSRFIDLSFDRNGKLIETSEPTRYGKDIEKELGYYKGKPAGKSLSWEELVPIGEKAEYRKDSINKETFLYGGIIYGIPVLILFILFFVSWWKRKRRLSYDKTRLEDL